MEIYPMHIWSNKWSNFPFSKEREGESSLIKYLNRKVELRATSYWRPDFLESKQLADNLELIFLITVK